MELKPKGVATCQAHDRLDVILIDFNDSVGF